MRAATISGLIVVVAMSTLRVADAAEDPRVRQVEIEVARLQREVAAQQRRIDQLERELRMGPTARSTPGAPRAAESSPAWLVVGNWDRVRTGMKELEVIAVLGRPTSARQDPETGQQMFFWAMEMGPTSVLAGSVRFGKEGVAEVRKPELR